MRTRGKRPSTAQCLVDSSRLVPRPDALLCFILRARTMLPLVHFVPGATEPMSVRPVPSALHTEKVVPSVEHLSSLGLHELLVLAKVPVLAGARAMAPSLQTVPGATEPDRERRAR